ncbi:hypothetical protein LINPERHAP1_LOCUS36035 [Linum perenne]
MARLLDLSLQRRRMMSTLFFIFSVLLVLVTILERRRRPIVRRRCGRRLLHRLVRGARVRADFINDATKFSDRSSLDTIRMDRALFVKLCKKLVEEGVLQRTPTVSIEEMVVMFLYTLGHNVKNRIVQKKFGRSGKTVCAALHAVLTSILRLHQTLYQKAFPVHEHSQHPHWKHFKNCIGALDGTHVKVRVNIEDQPRYRNRKGEVSINVLGVCNPDGQFIYCLAGWEGSAHDARVLPLQQTSRFVAGRLRQKIRSVTKLVAGGAVCRRRIAVCDRFVTGGLRQIPACDRFVAGRLRQSPVCYSFVAGLL